MIPGIRYITQVKVKLDGPPEELPFTVGKDEDGNICLLTDRPIVVSSTDNTTVICLVV